MLASSIPSKIQLPFASSGTKNTIPVPSQIGITPGAASYTDGFPPLTFTALTAGGIPPDGADVNGVLNAITAIQQWQSAGGHFKYDSAFSTAIGGYPAGAILNSSDGLSQWLSLADNNTTDPDGATPANWAALSAYGITTVSGLTNANVTLTATQYKNRIIVLTGTLTGNIQIIFPTLFSDWKVINNTTGAFTVTCKTAAGTGGIVSGSGGIQEFYGDGTNLISSIGDGRYILTSGGGQMTGPLNEAQGANIASAATVNLDTATGNYVHITGTTTINGITLSQGRSRTVVFDGALTLTNGASLIMPGGANITTTPGDSAVFRGEAGGVVRCVSYLTQTGGKMLLTASVATTSGTAVDFTGIPAWAKRITVAINGISTNGTSNTIIQLGTSGGVETSGYLSGVSGASSTGATTGFVIGTQQAASVNHGLMILINMGSNIWIESSSVGYSDASAAESGGGSKSALAGTLDRIRLTTVAGTATFDLGLIALMIEG